MPSPLCHKLMTLACCTLVLLVGSVAAQETTGDLEGRVVDEAGEPVSGVNITMTGPALQGTRVGVSLESGFFRIPALAVGAYEATLSQSGYQTLSFEAVRVRLGQTTDLGACVLASGVRDAETIQVTAQRRADPVSTHASFNLASEEFENLPIDRDYQTMALLLPHVTPSYEGDAIVGNGVNFSGATELENRYYVQGVDVTEPFWGANAMPLPYNFVREVQVRTGSYGAEYRSSLGGSVDVITHSGSNEFQGEVFGHYIDNNLSRSGRLSVGAPPEGDFGQFDVGFGVGGPIQRDRLWFYAAGNVGRVQEDAPIPGLETRTDETDNYRFAAKLDWTANARNEFALSFIGGISRRDAIGNWADTDFTPLRILQPETYLWEQKTTPYLLSLEGNHFVGDRLSFESDLSLFNHKYEELPAADPAVVGPTYIDTETGEWSGGHAGSLINDYQTLAAGLKGTMLSENHTWKAGVEYRQTMGSQTGDGGYLWRTPDGLGGETYTWFRYFTVDPDLESGSRNPSAFLQDSWRLGTSLRLNLGIRWDGVFMIDSNGDVAQKILNQWQPRAGFTYLLGEEGTRKIHGSVGRFYQDLGVLAANHLFNEAGGYRRTNYPQDPRQDTSGGVDDYYLTGIISDEIDGLDGQHYDEFTLGYEHGIEGYGRAGIRGVYRTLRKGIEDSWSPSGDYVVGNPGFGDLSFLPKLKREYAALEFSYGLSSQKGHGLFASYVLSRTEGNYTGLFATDFNQTYPNFSQSFDDMRTTVDAEGRLPNDRPHVFKLNGWYHTHFGLLVGASALWMSGTPLNEFGGRAESRFFVPRGEAGRTPSVWDLGLRFVYDFPMRENSRVTPKLLLDVLHIGSPREDVAYDQRHYYGEDTSAPNPAYGEPIRFQPPMAVRLGLEMGF